MTIPATPSCIIPARCAIPLQAIMSIFRFACYTINHMQTTMPEINVNQNLIGSSWQTLSLVLIAKKLHSCNRSRLIITGTVVSAVELIGQIYSTANHHKNDFWVDLIGSVDKQSTVPTILGVITVTGSMVIGIAAMLAGYYKLNEPQSGDSNCVRLLQSGDSHRINLDEGRDRLIGGA
jgi:hypothetical protein